MLPQTKRASVAVPLKDVEPIEGPVGELSVPRLVADKGFEYCSTWVTGKLIYLSNEIGRRGIAVTSSSTDFIGDKKVSQIIRLYGVRVNEYVLMEERQYESTPN